MGIEIKNDISIDVRAGCAIVKQRQPLGHWRDRDYKKGSRAGSGAKRGGISGWSRKSRKRMLIKAASLRNAGNGLFITLTYPDSVAGKPEFGSEMIKRHLKIFSQRLLYRFPNAGAMWRVEVVPRKSGALKGRLVPHFHIVLVSPTRIRLDTVRSELRRAWYEIAHDGDKNEGRAGVDVQFIHSRKHAMFYVSKYVAKGAEESAEGELFVVGRHWGVFGAWDTESYYKAPMSYRQFVEFRRLMARWLKSRGSGYAKKLTRLAESVGFTIFGVGDETESGDFVYTALQHALKIASDPPLPAYAPLYL